MPRYANRPRLVRRLLVLALLGVAAAVAWNLRRAPTRPETPGQPARGEASGTKVGELFFIRFNEGGRPVEVKARAMTTAADGSTMHLESVEASLPFVSEGKAAIARIRADRCDYQPQPVKASFRGNVVIKTDDGMEIESESLDYDSEKSEATTQELVRFRRGIASGTSVGMRYRADSQLELWADVKLQFARAGAPPTEIEAGNASASKAENRIYLNDGVLVKQGAREVRSGRLQLNMANEFRTIQHAAAIDDVLVRIGPGAELPGGTTGSPGEKQLRCRRLNVGFSETGDIAEATGVNPATLDLLPGPGDPESRRLTSQRIGFAFDEQGHLSLVKAFAGDAGEEVQMSVLISEPRPPSTAPARRVECKDILVTLDPATGGIAHTRFDREVVFSEPGRKAWADRSEYDGKSGPPGTAGRTCRRTRS